MKKILIIFIISNFLTGVLIGEEEKTAKKNQQNEIINILNIIKKTKKNRNHRNTRKIHPDGMTRLGIIAEALNPDLALYFKVKNGILVKKIIKNSSAETADIKVGDIIINSQTKNIKTVRDMIKSLQNNNSGDVDLKIVRRGQTIDILVKLPPLLFDKKNVIAQKPTWRNLWKNLIDQSWFGLKTEELTPKLISLLKTDNGALISEVKKKTPAEKFGFEIGDFITKWSDEPVRNSKNLKQLIHATKVGVNTNVSLIRNGEKINLQVSIEFNSNIHHPFLGTKYSLLTPQLAKYFKVKNGVLVSSVVEKSPADIAGLKAGDVLIRWNEKNLAFPKELLNALNDSKVGEIVKILVARNGEKKHFEVTIGIRTKTRMEEMKKLQKQWRNQMHK